MRVVACACVGCGFGCSGVWNYFLFFFLSAFVVFCVWWAVQITNNKKPARGGRDVLCAGVDYLTLAGGVV